MSMEIVKIGKEKTIIVVKCGYPRLKAKAIVK
jgi:hypothetical protein